VGTDAPSSRLTVVSAGRELVERAWGRVLGADPGLVRLRSAARTTVALGAVLGVLGLLALVADQPGSGVLVGAVVAMAPVLTPSDPDARHRRTTTALLAAGAAAAGLTAGLLLGPHRLAGDVGLVLVSAGALAVRRFGLRAALLGTAALLAYFAAVLLGSPTADLPWLLVSVGTGTAISHLVLGRLLPDRPEALQARTLTAFQVRLGGVVDTVADAVRAGRPGARKLGQVRASTARLSETALAVHDRLSRRSPVVTEEEGARTPCCSASSTSSWPASGSGPARNGRRPQPPPSHLPCAAVWRSRSPRCPRSSPARPRLARWRRPDGGRPSWPLPSTAPPPSRTAACRRPGQAPRTCADSRWRCGRPP
jgi:hypothetical protein